MLNLHECSTCKTLTQILHLVEWRKLSCHFQILTVWHIGGISHPQAPLTCSCHLKISIQVSSETNLRTNKLTFYLQGKTNCTHALYSQTALYHWDPVSTQASLISTPSFSQLQQFHFEAHYHWHWPVHQTNSLLYHLVIMNRWY